MAFRSVIQKAMIRDFSLQFHLRALQRQIDSIDLVSTLSNPQCLREGWSDIHDRSTPTSNLFHSPDHDTECAIPSSDVQNFDGYPLSGYVYRLIHACRIPLNRQDCMAPSWWHDISELKVELLSTHSVTGLHVLIIGSEEPAIIIQMIKQFNHVTLVYQNQAYCTDLQARIAGLLQSEQERLSIFTLDCCDEKALLAVTDKQSPVGGYDVIWNTDFLLTGTYQRHGFTAAVQQLSITSRLLTSGGLYITVDLSSYLYRELLSTCQGDRLIKTTIGRQVLYVRPSRYGGVIWFCEECVIEQGPLCLFKSLQNQTVFAVSCGLRRIHPDLTGRLGVFCAGVYSKQ
jgi:hypothetical protein